MSFFFLKYFKIIKVPVLIIYNFEGNYVSSLTQ